LFFLRCGRFLGVGAAKCDDASASSDRFEGVFSFHFGFGSGFGALFFNAFVALIGNGFGAFLFLNGFVEALELFFFWSTRLGELLLGTSVTGRSLLRRPLRSSDPSLS
jgi:hypothetical protein